MTRIQLLRFLIFEHFIQFYSHCITKFGIYLRLSTPKTNFLDICCPETFHHRNLWNMFDVFLPGYLVFLHIYLTYLSTLFQQERTMASTSQKFQKKIWNCRVRIKILSCNSEKNVDIFSYLLTIYEHFWFYTFYGLPLWPIWPYVHIIKCRYFKFPFPFGCWNRLFLSVHVWNLGWILTVLTFEINVLF